jgi:hypothetical protein
MRRALSVAAIMCLLVGGVAGCYVAAVHTHEKTVFVHGYYRSDGSYVNQYWRRRSGEAQEDRSWDSTALLSALAIVSSLVWGYTRARELICGSTSDVAPSTPAARYRRWPRVNVAKLHPARPAASEPSEFDSIPLHRTVARKQWHCARCRQGIAVRQPYWYYHASVGRYARRARYCDTCGQVLQDRHLVWKAASVLLKSPN